MDSLPGIEYSLLGAFSELGQCPNIKDLRSLIGPGIRTILTNIEPSLAESELNLLERSYRESYDTTGCLKSALYPDVLETLDQISGKGVKLFIVTNKPRKATLRMMAKFNLSSYFHEVLTLDSRTPHFKSKGQMLEYLIKKHRVIPPIARMIGDREEDKTGADDANIPFIHATYGYGKLPVREMKSIDHFSALLNLYNR